MRREGGCLVVVGAWLSLLPRRDAKILEAILCWALSILVQRLKELIHGVLPSRFEQSLAAFLSFSDYEKWRAFASFKHIVYRGFALLRVNIRLAENKMG